jgi:hypothetical protein
VSGVRFPEGFRLEPLRRHHPRRRFRSGQAQVDDWLATKALQHQEKHLSVTKVLLDDAGAITGSYTLATGQVDFGDLAPEIAGVCRAWALRGGAGVAGFSPSIARTGRLLLAQAARLPRAGKTFAFIAVNLDCIDDSAKAFYRHWASKTSATLSTVSFLKPPRRDDART